MPAEARPHPGLSYLGICWPCMYPQYPGAPHAGIHDGPQCGLQQGARTGAPPLVFLELGQPPTPVSGISGNRGQLRNPTCDLPPGLGHSSPLITDFFVHIPTSWAGAPRGLFSQALSPSHEPPGCGPFAHVAPLHADPGPPSAWILSLHRPSASSELVGQ